MVDDGYHCFANLREAYRNSMYPPCTLKLLHTLVLACITIPLHLLAIYRSLLHVSCKREAFASSCNPSCLSSELWNPVCMVFHLLHAFSSQPFLACPLRQLGALASPFACILSCIHLATCTLCILHQIEALNPLASPRNQAPSDTVWGTGSRKLRWILIAYAECTPMQLVVDNL